MDPVVATLLGTVVGAVGTILSQHVAGRATERSERRVRLAERRTELRTAIEGFLEVYQEMERAVSDDHKRSSELSHRMWFMHNRLALIASTDLLGPLGSLADALNRTYWHGTPDGQQAGEYLHEANRQFRRAAHIELNALELPSG
ncbi:hypothetical protein ABZ345_43810 [Lentzea sp. NPDC005914]|uniref:hypothetical protein n=1 Tax=Lentzea sp. NPDC005914 TaxID=3154572 RepID=UPI0033E2A6F3